MHGKEILLKIEKEGWERMQIVLDKGKYFLPVVLKLCGTLYLSPQFLSLLIKTDILSCRTVNQAGNLSGLKSQ